jgi:sugar/nucleoside kinase (ribokinase family)
MLRSVIDRLKSRLGVVTFGQRGCLVIDRDGVCHSAPSLATRVVDRIGAGDAFFAISALCAVQQAPSDILAFLGNLAGADSVAMVGNAERQAGDSLVRSVESLLK